MSQTILIDGWRIFMRRSALDLSDKLMEAGDSSGPDQAELALARAFVLAKHGHAAKARRIIDRLPSRTHESLRVKCDRILVDAHVRVYEDRPLSSEDAGQLDWALRTLDGNDHVGQALALNQLCIFALHMGNFDKAQEHAEGAIRLYQLGGAEFGSLHLHAHLGQIKMMRGDLDGAAAQYAEMETRLTDLPEGASALLAVCQALRSEVAYEMNDLRNGAALLSRAMASVEEDDAWVDVRAAAYRVRTRLAYAHSGLPGALTELAHCERVAKSRGMPRLLRLMQIERLRALTLSDELDAAQAVMHSSGLAPHRDDWDGAEDWALRQGSTAVALARWLVRSRRANEALSFIEPAEDFAIRGGQLLSLAKLRVIRAAAHWRLRQKTDATSALLSALRLLGKQPFRRFILDEGTEVHAIVQAALDGDHVTVQPSPQLRKRLSELNHLWITRNESKRSSDDSPRGHAESESTDRAHQTRYLELLALGHSNKEIAQILGVSVNTVKYHLKRIFSDLRADSRMRAVRRAQELRIIETDYPDG